MHKDSTTQAKQKKDEREEVLKEIRQLENRQKILENKQRNEERKARTRRLIERGAILEGVFSLAPDLPGVEVKAFLIPTVWGQYIEKLSEYMASTGKRYQSHAATIRRWASEDARKAAPPSRNRDYSVKEDETV